MLLDPALERLVALGLVIAVAAAAVGLALRPARLPLSEDDGLVLGYPAALFPARNASSRPALRTLAGVQTRLTALYRRLPAGADSGGDGALWLRVFLLELRSVMDAAYRTAVLTEGYAVDDRLDRLAAEVATLEVAIVDDLARRALSGAGPSRSDRLERRLAALRDCADELAAPSGAL